MNLTRAAFPLTALALASLLAACGNDDAQFNELPQGVTQLSATTYGATSVSTGATAAAQDLLTGGIGKTGLGAATAPVYADAANPSAAELRRNALYANYRGLVDPSVNGGYGRLYGPNIDLNGADTLGEGLVPGREYVGVLDDGSGKQERADGGADPGELQPRHALHRRRAVVRLARRLRRPRRRRVGAQARLRGRAHRRRQGHRPVRPDRRHRQPHRRHARDARRRRHLGPLRRQHHRRGAQRRSIWRSRTACRSSTSTRSSTPRRTGATTRWPPCATRCTR